MAHIGFIGLGTMGSRAARRLLLAGYTVIGYNRTRARAQPLLDAGLQWEAPPRAVAEAADVTFSMVTDNAALQEVFAGLDGILAGLRRGKVYVDMSTVSPALSRELAARVAEKGAQMLDVPVSGSPLTLEQGQATLLVGGDQATFQQVRPLLMSIGAKVDYIGGNGQGLVMKLAINLNLPIQLQGFGEGLLLAERAGVPREKAVEILLDTVIASPGLKIRGPFALQLPEHALFDVNLMQKDMVLAEELGREVNAPLPTAAVVNELLTAARGLGLAEQDFAALFQVLRQMAGLDK
jgi:3-hydroxyisobutyrate dehydrogenase-like beta-hydroxyacid dehydrogenase